MKTKKGIFVKWLARKESIIELVLAQSHVMFSLTSELSGSTVITSHTLTSWIIVTAALSAIDKVQKGLVGDIEAPGF